MLDARADGWLLSAERQVGKLCLRENSVATPGEVLQAEYLIPNTFLRTLLRLSHIPVRLLQDVIGDELREQGVDDIWPGVGLLSIRERQVRGRLHGARGIIIIREEGTEDAYGDGLGIAELIHCTFEQSQEL